MAGNLLHRFSVFLAVCTFFLVVAGASVTSNQAGLSVPDWPLSYGQVMPEMKGGVFYEHGHRMIATAVGFLTIILAVWLWCADGRRWMRWLGVASLAGVILQGVLGGITVLFMLPPAISIAHACLAQIFFSTAVAVALFTSRGWHQGAVPVNDAGWPSLRSLAVVTPVLVLLQIALGAAFRHRVLGIMPHILGAVLIGSVVLLFGVFVLAQFPDHAALRRSAWALTGITIVQMLLGVIAYFARMTTADAVQPAVTMVISTVSHVGGGALTMAATVALAIQILRHVRPRTAAFRVEGVPSVSR